MNSYRTFVPVSARRSVAVSLTVALALVSVVIEPADLASAATAATPGATGVAVYDNAATLVAPTPSATGAAAGVDSVSALPQGFTTTAAVTATDEYPVGVEDLADPGTLTAHLGTLGTLAVTDLDVNLNCFGRCVQTTTFGSLTLTLKNQTPLTVTSPPPPNSSYPFSGVGTLSVNTQSRGHGMLTTVGVSFQTSTGLNYVIGEVVGNFPSTTGDALAFTSAPVTGYASGAHAVAGPIAIQTQDATALAAPVLRSTTINLTSTSATGTFSRSRAGAPITSIVLKPGHSTVTVYYRDSTVGTPTLQAAASGYNPAMQTETVVAHP